MIDSHVHLRDWNWEHKETLEHGLIVADKVGLAGVFDMPNTSPAITTQELVEKRLDDAERVQEQIGSNVFYGLYIGVTPDIEQVKRAVEIWEKFFPESGESVGVIGLKMFAGSSTGDLLVGKEEEQRKVYEILTREGYEGVLAVHCEKESQFNSLNPFNPNYPRSHCLNRDTGSEIESVTDQIDFAREAGYAIKRGRLHLLHLTTGQSVDEADKAKKQGMRISCEVTPNHLLLGDWVMEMIDGVLYKVNPPLRGDGDRFGLVRRFNQGMINILGSDHAPHTFDEKTGRTLDKTGKSIYMSGIPSLWCWPHYIVSLCRLGLDGEKIERAVHGNIDFIFGTNIPYRGLGKRFGVSGVDGLAKLEDVRHFADDYAFDVTKYIHP